MFSCICLQPRRRNTARLISVIIAFLWKWKPYFQEHNHQAATQTRLTDSVVVVTVGQQVYTRTHIREEGQINTEKHHQKIRAGQKTRRWSYSSRWCYNTKGNYNNIWIITVYSRMQPRLRLDRLHLQYEWMDMEYLSTLVLYSLYFHNHFIDFTLV